MSNPEISFEFFPPNTDKMAATLWRSVERLAPLNPGFVSVTYGAGGSTRDRTHATVERIAKETGIAAAAHLSCLDYCGDAPWEISPAAKEWYARVKSRPAFRPLLADHIPGFPPKPHYADLDF